MLIGYKIMMNPSFSFQLNPTYSLVSVIFIFLVTCFSFGNNKLNGSLPTQKISSLSNM